MSFVWYRAGGQRCVLRVLRRMVCLLLDGMSRSGSRQLISCFAFDREDDCCLLDLPMWSETNGLGSQKGEPANVWDVWKEL